MKNVFIVMDYNVYNLSSAVVFATKEKLLKYLDACYNSLTEPTMYIDDNGEWGEVFESEEDFKQGEEPLAVFSMKKIRGETK